jgi:hypothetical protein
MARVLDYVIFDTKTSGRSKMKRLVLGSMFIGLSPYRGKTAISEYNTTYTKVGYCTEQVFGKNGRSD